MKIVVFDPNSTMIPQFGVMIDEALVAKKNGHDVTYITCGGCLDSCYSNPLKSKMFCKICVSDYKSNLTKFLGVDFQHKTLNDFSSIEFEQELENYDFKFETLADLKMKTFKGIDVGYAALSSFISNTRNMNPVLSPFCHDILFKMLKSAVRLSLLCEKIDKMEKPDKIYVYNGRLPESRPFLRYFRAKGIDVHILEDYPTNLTGSFKKITYLNDLPHSISYFQKKLDEEWLKNESKAHELGSKFFQNRRNASFAGDKVYVKDQKTGLLPKEWNPKMRNIVIFNSSEDEFAAVGTDWENKLFHSQIEGINHIFKCAEKYPNTEVYLRIHPNLKKIKYKYHTDLYTISNNTRVHVISADSEVSTYALVDAAEVVVSFGTSVGVEAAYSAKSVVLIGAAFYKGLGFCYEPKTISEMEDQVFTNTLKPLSSSYVLKYGNYIMCDKGQDFSHYNFNCTQFTFGKFRTPNVAMIDQAISTFSLIKSFCMRVWRELQRKYLKFIINEV